MRGESTVAKRLVIGGEGEYVRRLSGYLMNHLAGEVLIHSYTDPGLLAEREQKADLYLLEETFYKGLVMINPVFSGDRVLILGEEEGEDRFCRYDRPYRLVSRIDQRLFSSCGERKESGGRNGLTAVYAPFSGMSLKDWIMPRMNPGDLYLGLQDMGPEVLTQETGGERKGRHPFSFSSREDRTDEESEDMRDLCYYIHLREESLFEKLDRMVRCDEGRFYLESPPWFFDFLGLTEEDFRWFYLHLKDKAFSGEIYVGLGNSAVPSLEIFRLFDRLIILDFPGKELIQSFCLKLVRTLEEDGTAPLLKIEMMEYMEDERVMPV